MGESASGLTFRSGKRFIRTMEDWFEAAPPKGGGRHWKTGRSAMELARACCEEDGCPSIPAELAAALSGVVDTSDVILAYPEHTVRFDGYAGEPANLDLALIGKDGRGAFVVGIEAKADEPFGHRVESVLRAGAQRIARDEPTNAVARVQDLARALLPTFHDGLPHLGELRYQLLTGIAGTLALARAEQATRAVFVVYELMDPKKTAESNRRRNRDDLDRFVRSLSGAEVPRLKRGEPAGPWRVAGNGHIPAGVDLHIVKVRRELRTPLPNDNR